MMVLKDFISIFYEVLVLLASNTMIANAESGILRRGEIHMQPQCWNF